MTRLTLRSVEAARVEDREYIIWDDDLPGFGLRVFMSGKRSYIVQYRAFGRSRRYTIGLHGVWTPETARREAKVQLGRVAKGENPAEERKINHKAITVKELCELYVKDLDAGVILGKGGRPKKASTVAIDEGRILRHIVPLLGTRRVQDLTRAEMIIVMNNITVGKTCAVIKTKKLRGKAVVRGGPGAARRTIGSLGGILTYAVNADIIDGNPVHGIQRPKGNPRTRRLSEAEYRTLGAMLAEAAQDEDNAVVVEIIRQLALTGCRRGEMIKLKWSEVDYGGSCLRLADSKEGASVRPVGLTVIERLERRMRSKEGEYVFPGRSPEQPFGYFQNRWKRIFDGSPLSDITPHILRHSFSSIANDLGFTEVTIAALIGHAKGSITGRYIHTLDTALIMAADNISGYIEGLLNGAQFKQNSYALDRASRKASMSRFLANAAGDEAGSNAEVPLAA